MKQETNNIYSILGVDPNTKSNHLYHNDIVREEEFVDDPNAPSGSIFDNYSNYPNEGDNYWQFFRSLTILGIVSVLSVIGYFIWDPASVRTHSHQESGESQYVVKDESSENVYNKSIETTLDASSIGETETVSTSIPEILYFSGKVNNKYAVSMRIDTESMNGEYYYNRVGNTSRNMRIEIEDIYEEEDGTYHIRLNEYTSTGTYTGSWDGIYKDGVFHGEGIYNGKSMPFSLNISSAGATGL